MALSEATKAVAAMGEIARVNLERGCKQLMNYDPSGVPEIEQDEECLDTFADTSDHFLIGLSKVVENDAEDRHLDMLMQTVPNFERIGDYATNLVELSQRLDAANVEFSENAKKELAILSNAINEIIVITLDAFTRNDNEAAKLVEPLEEVIDDMVLILRDRHTKRLKKGECTVDTGLIFMEALTHLERASDQCSSIAVMMLAREDESILNNHYDYLRYIHSGNDAAYVDEKNRRRAQYIEPLKNIV